MLACWYVNVLRVQRQGLIYHDSIANGYTAIYVNPANGAIATIGPSWSRGLAIHPVGMLTTYRLDENILITGMFFNSYRLYINLVRTYLHQLRY